VVAWLFRADGQTDRRNEAIAASRSFADAPKNSLICRHVVVYGFLIDLRAKTAILCLKQHRLCVCSDGQTV